MTDRARATARPVIGRVSSDNSQLSRTLLVELIAILSSSKLHLELTEVQAEIWFRLLRIYELKTIQRAGLEIAITSESFPNVRTIAERCRVIRREGLALSHRKEPGKMPTQLELDELTMQPS